MRGTVVWGRGGGAGYLPCCGFLEDCGCTDSSELLHRMSIGRQTSYKEETDYFYYQMDAYL